MNKSEQKKKLPRGIRRRGDSYEVRVCRNYHVYTATAKTVELALKKQTEISYQLDHEVYIEPSTLSFADWYAVWQKEYKSDLKIGSRETYNNLYNVHLKDEFSKLKLQKIRQIDIKRIINKLKQTGKMGAANTLLNAILKPCFQCAVENDMIEKNPAAGIKSKDLKYEKKHHVCLTEEQIRQFIEYAKGNRYYNLFRLSILSGVRPGEALAIRWRDIDYVTRNIHIQHTLKYTTEKGLFLDLPKTNESIRDIHISAPIMEVLSDIKAHETEINLDNPIFHGRHYAFVREENENRAIASIVKKMRKDGLLIPDFTGHSFRVIYATTCANNGTTPNVLCKLMGHTTPQTTLKVYTQAPDDSKEAAMENVAGAFKNFWGSDVAINNNMEEKAQ
jgi:integrase